MEVPLPSLHLYLLRYIANNYVSDSMPLTQAHFPALEHLRICYSFGAENRRLVEGGLASKLETHCLSKYSIPSQNLVINAFKFSFTRSTQKSLKNKFTHLAFFDWWLFLLRTQPLLML